ncbi:MAG: DUF4432 family protein [Planctomycetes bacterium]|nr:DUF4432 family protein [Planctomycetota bacterium]
MTRQSHPVVSRGRGDTASTANDALDITLGRLRVRTGRIRGGRGDGMLVVELAAGATSAIVLPDRGLGIWKAWSGPTELGWQSPVAGPVHPRGVPLMEPSGLGWLDGFDELVARCGLVSNGAPDFDAAGRLLHPLHGRIANLPAHAVEVVIDDKAGTVELAGAVDETRFHFHALRMSTRIVVHADRPLVTWTDEVTNLSDRPTTMQMLYHVNLGPPLLGAGAELLAAVDEVAPRDTAAMPDGPTWRSFEAPRAGRPEEAHFARIRPDDQGTAEAVLLAPGGREGARLAWFAESLPCFTLWKNQTGNADGYVTGLEPGTNFPNPRSFEESQGRVVTLAPRAAVQFDLALEHVSGARLDEVRTRIAALAARRPTTIHPAPRSGWSRLAAWLVALSALGLSAGADAVADQTGPPRRVLAADDSTRTLALVGADGSIAWRRPVAQIHDLHLLPDGHLLSQEGWTRVVETDRDGKVVWSYDGRKEHGDRPVEIHAFERLPDGATMIAESGPARIVEVDGEGKIRHVIPLTVDRPAVHSDTRNVRRTPAGTYLVAHERDGVVREYDTAGRVVWEFDVPLFGREPKGGHGPEAFGDQVYSAVRLANGNTLIGTGNGHAVLEVTPAKEIVWHLAQHDLPGITLAWVTQVRRLANGNTQLVNCHAGPDNPQIIEVTPDKRVAWTFRDFVTFGNSLPVAVVFDP